MSAILGIDIAKASFDCVLLYQDKSSYRQFSNTPQGFDQLHSWLSDYSVEQVHVGMEATGHYGDALALNLYSAGFTVSIINARYLKAYRQSLGNQHKTDKQDAALIARFCAERKPEAWQPSSPLIDRLKQQTRYLQNLITMRQQERNRLQSGITDSWVKQQLQAHIEYLNAEIDAFKKRIHQLIMSDISLKNAYQLLLSIPAIGKGSAPILLAEIETIERFDSADALASYAGLTPRLFQSGTSVNRRARLSKHGNVHLRTALYMPALGAPRWNARCASLQARLKKKGKNGKSIIAANMHLLLRIVFGVLKHQQPYDPTYLQKEQLVA